MPRTSHLHLNFANMSIYTHIYIYIHIHACKPRSAIKWREGLLCSVEGLCTMRRVSLFKKHSSVQNISAWLRKDILFQWSRSRNRTPPISFNWWSLKQPPPSFSKLFHPYKMVKIDLIRYRENKIHQKTEQCRLSKRKVFAACLLVSSMSLSNWKT